MPKEILGVCAALVALTALAIPASAMAAASVAETSGPGTYSPLAVGAKITATQNGEAIFEAGGSTIKCNENWMTGEIHTNDATNGITGTITAAKFQGTKTGTKCESSLLGNTTVDIPALTNEGGSRHWCIKSVPGADNFEALGRGCTESGSGTFTFILTGEITTCAYTRGSGLNYHFTTTEEDPKAATLKVTGEPEFAEEGGKLLCPDTLKITQMAFYLYTENAEETPVYITD